MTDSPQFRAALAYMRHKGYPDATPTMVEAVEGRSCWYFTFDLDDGVLELEVEWDGESWHWEPTGFWPKVFPIAQ